MSIPTLQGEQTSILYLPKEQNLLIVGSAGTGKSLLAMYKSIYLAVSNPGEKILLLTFNRAVNNKIKEDCKIVCEYLNQEYPKNLIIDTIYSFSQKMIVDLAEHIKERGYTTPTAKNILQFLKVEKRDTIPALMSAKKEELIAKAVQETSEKYSDMAIFKRSAETYIEEISWIERWDIADFTSYKAADRVGRRKHRIRRDDREYIWEIYISYLQLMESSDNNRLYSFDSIYRYLNQFLNEYRKCVQNEENSKYQLYKYIIIDEFQDLTPSMANLIKTLITCKNNQNLENQSKYILIGDVAQSVFGKRMTWTEMGFNTHARHTLSQNYRNSYQIATYAEKIAESRFFDKKNENYVAPDIREIYMEKPYLLRYENINTEIKEICELAVKRMETGTVGIIVPGKEIKNLKNHLKSSNIKFEGFTQANSSSKLQIGTIKQVKGLEFDTVILPLKSKEQYAKELGSQGVVWEADIDIENPPENAVDTLELFITNLYVEVTRARSGLIISYSGEESPILPEVSDVNFVDRRSE